MSETEASPIAVEISMLVTFPGQTARRGGAATLEARLLACGASLVPAEKIATMAGNVVGVD